MPRRLVRHRAFLQDSAALAAGSLVSGLLAYVFFVLATRSLGAVEAAPLSVLWTYWAAATAVLSFPLQHWVIQTVQADRHEGTVARSLPRIWVGSAVLALLAGAIAYVAREPLFNDDGPAFPAMVSVITAGACLTGLVRGGLAARLRYRAAALAFSADNGLRVLLGLGAVLLGGGSVAFGLAMSAGSLVGLAWPQALRFTRSSDDPPPVHNPLALMSGLAAGSLIAQLMLTGPPFLLVAEGGRPGEVTAFFSALALWRAPYIPALGLSPQASHLFARRATSGDLRFLRRMWELVLAAGLVTAAVFAVLGATLVHSLLPTIFGADIRLDRLPLALLGVGTALALANLVLLLLLAAQGRSRTASVVWTVAVVLCLSSLLVVTASPVVQVAVAFVIGQATAFAGMLLVCSRLLRRRR